MSAALVGTWVRASSENEDAYMDAMGVPPSMRAAQTDTLTIAVDGDNWTQTHSNSTGEGTPNSFTLTKGKMVEYTSQGVPMKGIITAVGDKVVEEHYIGDIKVDMTKEIINGQMCMSFTAKGVTMKVFYNKK